MGAVAALIVVVLLAMRGFGVFDRDDGSLTLFGNVDVRQVDLAFLVSGRIEAIGPEEGEKVRKGAVLARIDRRQLADALAGAQAKFDIAEANLDKATSGSRRQEVATAQANLDKAQAAFEQASKDVQRRSRLVETGAVSRQVYDATLAQRRRAKAEVDAATQALSLAREGARTEDREEAAARAKAAQAERNAARTDLEETVLLAPNDGTVLTRARELGAIVRAGDTVLTLTIDKPVRVRAYVGERDLSRIAPGMKVRVKADGIEKAFAGRISQISPTAEFTPKTVQTEDLRTDLVYRVRILVDGAEGALRQGQPVTVDVEGAKPLERD